MLEFALKISLTSFLSQKIREIENFLLSNQDQIRDKSVLELGAGTALPGLLCAKIGARKVYLSDEAEQANTIKNIAEAVRLNDLQQKVGNF